MMQMEEERVSKSVLHTKVQGKRTRGRFRTRWRDQIRKDTEMRQENCEEIQETGSERIKTHIFGNNLRMMMKMQNKLHK